MSKILKVSASFTRPANTTAYTAGDVVSNDATTTTPMPLTCGDRGVIVGARLETNKKSITPQVRINLLVEDDGTIAGDNAAHKEVYADVAKRIGYIDLTAMTTPADTSNSDLSVSQNFAVRIPFVNAGTLPIYAVLTAIDGFTPASGQGFTLTLLVEV